MKEISHVEDMLWVHFRQTNPIFLSQINAGAKDMEDADAEFIDGTVEVPVCASVESGSERHEKVDVALGVHRRGRPRPSLRAAKRARPQTVRIDGETVLCPDDVDICDRSRRSYQHKENLEKTWSFWR